jgi:hypothetical protein
MGMRKRPYGEWWRTLNLAVHGVGGSNEPLGHMGWGYERILGVEGSFQVIPDLSKKASMLDSNMICDVRI